MEHTEQTIVEQPLELQAGPQPKKSFSFSLPVAIIIAGVMISGAIMFSQIYNKNQPVKDPSQKQNFSEIRSVDEKDHVFGNRDAEIMLIEYSDPECPFCKTLNPTLYKVVESYGEKVAWTYRHFPLDSIHPKARIKIEALECVNDLSGNEKFFNYLDKIFEITESQELITEAGKLGVDSESFAKCINTQAHQKDVDTSIQEGIQAGVEGTPTTFILQNGKLVTVFVGAQSFEYIQEVIDGILKK